MPGQDHTIKVIEKLADLQPLMPRVSSIITLLVVILTGLFIWAVAKGRRDKLLTFFLQTFQPQNSDKPAGVLVAAAAVTGIYLLLLIRGSLFGTWPPEYILSNVQGSMYSLFGVSGLLAGVTAYANRTTASTTEVKQGPPTVVVKKEVTGPADDQPLPA